MSRSPNPTAPVSGDDARPIQIDAILPPSGNKDPGSSTVSPFARVLAYILDDAVRIPGTQRRIGLDPILGFFFPGVGDALSATAGTALVAEAIRRGVPPRTIVRMGFNLLLNAAAGSIPIVGDIFSAWFKSNAQNYSLLVRFTADPSHPVVRPTWWPVLAILVLAFLSIVACWTLTFFALHFLVSRIPGLFTG